MRFFLIILCLSINVSAREHIRIVGSATLYPFITIAAEKFGKIYGYTPVVETTGTGGGFKLFCSGSSSNYPDIVAASRLMKESEVKLCKTNNVQNIKYITWGYDGIVVAQNTEAKSVNLTLKHLFMGLSKFVPINGKMANNPYQTWKEIDPSLPNNKIEFYGPSFTSGTRDSFVELVMHEFCSSSEEIIQIIPNKNERLSICSAIREDGHYIDISENYNLIIKKLQQNPKSFGLISFSLLKENSSIRAIKINGAIPTKISIVKGEYPIARPLFLYFNLQNQEIIQNLNKFIYYISTPQVIGPEGYLTQKGLITTLF